MALASKNWLAGEQLGNRFDGVRLIRAGTRFTLYEAREVGTQRPVVIKTPDKAGATWLHEVLDHEASVLTAVGAHPHIVTLYERFVLDDGRPALMLEPCPGSLLDRLRHGGTVPVQDAVAIGIKIASALETLHAAGVLHLDVRPRNILVSERGEPVLAGFDESSRVDAAGLDGSVRPPMHVTTPHTAPELLEGLDASVRSDVYGLASTLYELVAGRAAFRAYAGESPATVILRVLSGRAAPIFSPSIPLEMSDLMTWALSPDPAKRPPTPAWLAEELGRIERHEGWPRTRLVGV